MHDSFIFSQSIFHGHIDLHTYLSIYVNTQTKSITVSPDAMYTALFGIINSLFSVEKDFMVKRVFQILM